VALPRKQEVTEENNQQPDISDETIVKKIVFDDTVLEFSK
jgi:hypothetical protein